MSEGFAPVVVFVYRREIDALIGTLKKDPLSADSDLFIFSDGSKNSGDAEDVRNVRASLNRIDGFKSVNVVESSFNKGLAGSIIDGVTEIMGRYGKAIVLEDDLMVSDDFLHYMNEALDYYESDSKIWSVTGYGPGLPCLEQYDKDLYLSARISSWGWASWKERWETIDWEIPEFERLRKDQNFRKNFDAAGNDLYKMLELQMLGKIDSWAIRWQYNQFRQKRFTVYPKKSKVIVGGFSDGKGTHNSGYKQKWDVELSNGHVRFERLDADPEILKCFARFYNLGWATQIGYLLKKIGGYGLAKKIYLQFQKGSK